MALPMSASAVEPVGIAVFAALCVAVMITLWRACHRLRRDNARLASRNQELERSSEARTRFVGNMSHELRTPLNAVIGFAELLHDEWSGPVSEAQREHLEIIRYSADHLLALVNEVLDLARIEAGHMRLDPEPVQPAEIALRCMRSLRPMADERGVELHLEPADVGTVALDPGRLRQVVLNYLANAIRFTGPGGKVTMTLARDADRLGIEVADTGIGISREDQGRIFEEFVQVGSAASGGGGLGLAVTRQIVQAQGGQVGVSSQPGLGSTFYAWLPCVEVVGEPPGRARPAPSWRRRVGAGGGLGSRTGTATALAVRSR
jgi:signal transduction histidine kinase